MPVAFINSAQLLEQGMRARGDSGATLAELTMPESAAAVAAPADALTVLHGLVSGPGQAQLDPALVGVLRGFRTPLEAATWFINAKYAALGGAGGWLGAASGSVAAAPGTAGFEAVYQHGAIYWLAQVGAHALQGPILARWLQLGGPPGWLGFPTSEVEAGRDARSEGGYAHFEGGSIYWAPLPPKIGTPVQALAGTLAPLAAQAPAAPLAVSAVIRAATPTAVSARPEFAVAPRPVAESTAGAFEVHGAIREKYLALGAEASILGYPRTDETGTPDGIGRFNHFEGGSIYWTPASGAHEVHGLIRDQWAASGWERNPQLGYPISDELIPDRRIGHRRPETRSKPIAAVPRGVIKLPAEAVSAGFPASVLAAATPAAARAGAAPVAAAAATAPPSPAALGRLSDKLPTAVPLAEAIAAVQLPGPVGPIGSIGIAGQVPPPAVSTEADPRSVNRFADFESGVLFWARGTTAATALAPLAKTADGTVLSFSAADIASSAWGKLGAGTFVAPNQSPGTLSFIGMTGYSHDGAQVHNRRHRLQLIVQGIESHNSGGPFNLPVPAPVTAVIELHVEVWFDAALRRLALTLTDWSLSQSSSGTYGAAVAANLHARLDPLVWTAHELAVLPDTNADVPIAVLSVKALGNGAVAVYIEPPAGGLRTPAVLDRLVTTAVAPSVVHLAQPN